MRELGITPIELDIKDGLVEPLMAAIQRVSSIWFTGVLGKTACYRDCYVRSVFRSRAQVSVLQPSP